MVVKFLKSCQVLICSLAVGTFLVSDPNLSPSRPCSAKPQQPNGTATLLSLGKDDQGFPVKFVDVAASAGLTEPIIYGGVERKKYIIETNGSGVAFLDYDNDGWIDILLLNGTRLEGFPKAKRPPLSYIGTKEKAASRMSPSKQDCARPDGARRFASVITTMTSTKISSSLIGVRTFSIKTMATARSQRQQQKPDSARKVLAGVRAVLSSTMIATETS